MSPQRRPALVASIDSDTALAESIDALLEELSRNAWYHSLFEPGAGKMFGVLLCRSGNETVCLKGFSGLLCGSSNHPGFVPPVCEIAAVENILRSAQTDIDALDTRINHPQQQRLLQDNIATLVTLEQQANAELDALRNELLNNKQHRAASRLRLLKDDEALRQLGHQSSNDRKRLKQARQRWQLSLDEARAAITSLENTTAELKQARAGVSQRAQQQVFSQYQLCAPDGSRAPLTDFFPNQLPPSGTGDCAAPKLLHHANLRGLEILSLAEFWVGASPADGVRRHGYVYPPCRGKCQPVMPHLLGEAGLPARPVTREALTVLYEDDALAVLEKPAGMLSVPGKTGQESVYSQLQQRYPQAQGPLLVHRLDMDTSGILLMAKTAADHKHLQRQFIQRRVQKQYIAVLDGIVHADNGELNLPLRVDLLDRPRQLVCASHGKPARTRYQVLERYRAMDRHTGNEASRTRILFIPETGRTHQLRVHSAHVNGLGAPIVGDPLYGKADSRMHLHASHLAFAHPQSGKPVSFDSRVPF